MYESFIFISAPWDVRDAVELESQGGAPGEPRPRCGRSVPSPCTCASWAAWPLRRVDPCFLLSLHSKTVLFLNVSDTRERNGVGKSAMESPPGGDVWVEMAAHRSHLRAPSPPCVPGFVNDPLFKSRPPRHTGFPTDQSAAPLVSPKNRGVMRPRAGRCNARPQVPTEHCPQQRLAPGSPLFVA